MQLLQRALCKAQHIDIHPLSLCGQYGIPSRLLVQRALREQHEAALADFQSSSEEGVSTLQCQLEAAVAAHKETEAGLRKDLDEVHAQSSQRTKELKKQLEVQEVYYSL